MESEPLARGTVGRSALPPAGSPQPPPLEQETPMDTSIDRAPSGPLQVFSWPELLSRTMDDPRFAAQMVGFFRTESVEQLDAIRTGLARSDRTAVRTTAHTLRGAAANMSGEALASAADRLEAAAPTASSDEMALLLHAVEEQVRILFDAMAFHVPPG